MGRYNQNPVAVMRPSGPTSEPEPSELGAAAGMKYATIVADPPAARLLAPSDPIRHNLGQAEGKYLSSQSPLAVLRPQPPSQVASLSQEATMPERIYDGIGRPPTEESDRRKREFIRHLAANETARDAAKKARMKADAVLTALDEQEFRTVVFALLDGRADAVTVTVAPASELAA